ncbi:MAG: hypothetical protein A2Y81_06265 [Nitrospirae bacterium RBG_13_43_8]|nr:MAG: hypothetical protein A2Y81_06265 [Nitrospirae bacterium RBG_13_43_8]
MNVYFSDVFGVDPDLVEAYGAFNISLINDLPLFIDPFLLFNSKKPEYQILHDEILRYVAFLRDMSIEGVINPGLLKNWFVFPEVKQNWLGYSEMGNDGHGLGIDFARSINKNLNQIFLNFGNETITKGSHLEKLCLIKAGVGRDNISDFTTNLIKGYLLEYTQKFAQNHIRQRIRRNFAVERVYFNYETRSWVSKRFDLPIYNGNFVVLTPRDILTKDDTWINKSDIVNRFYDVVVAIPNQQLRAQINQYFAMNLPRRKKKDGKSYKQPSKKEIAEAVSHVITEYPEFIDYYIRFKEDNGDEAKSVSETRVQEVENLFVRELSGLIHTLIVKSHFYKTGSDTIDECYQRVLFLKDVIENKDGYRIFYIKGEPLKRESDLHIMFRLTWFATPSDVSPETNDGRGPVDFKISRESQDKTLVEFKLAGNSKLKQNLAKQVEIYKKAHDTDKAIKVILFFTYDEEQKVKAILKELDIENEKYMVLIDARNDNKPSASIA